MGPGPAGRAAFGHRFQGDPRRLPRSCAFAPVLGRSGRDRRRYFRPAGDRAALRGPASPVDPGGRRSDPEAHEAAPFARRRDRRCKPRAQSPRRRGADRRSDRRVPHRKRRGLRQYRGAGRRNRPRRRACVPLFAARQHARRAHATARRRNDLPSRRSAASCGRGIARARSRPAHWRNGTCAGRSFAPRRAGRAGHARAARPRDDAGQIVPARILGHDGRQLRAAA